MKNIVYKAEIVFVTLLFTVDHSRVKLLPLDDEEGSDFINANFIPVSNKQATYFDESQKKVLLKINEFMSRLAYLFKHTESI